MNKKFIKSLILIIVLFVLGKYIYNILYTKEVDKNFLVLYGNVDIRQVDLGFRVSGRIDKMIYDEGDLVSAGKVVATLDSKPYSNEVVAKRAELGMSEANYLKYKNGSRPQEISTAEASVIEQQAVYSNSLKLYDRQKHIVSKGAVAKQDFDNTVAQRLTSEQKLKSAKENLSLFKEGFRKEDVLAAKSQVDASKAGLDSALIKYNDTRIIAPNEGIILTRIQEPGAIVSVGTPVYTLSLTKPIWVRTYISEINLGKIYPGMKALVYTDSRPNNPYEGQIGFISPVAEFTPKNVETTDLRTDLVYRLRVIINNPDKYLRQGMPVTVKLKLVRENEQ